MTDIALEQTGVPNCTVVRVGDVSFLFSYETCVAFRDSNSGWVVCENLWGTTTDKHLNWTYVDRKDRVPYDEFQDRLKTVLQGRRVQ